MIGVRSMTARNTGEGALIGAISFVDTATDGTFPTGIARVNRAHRNACPPRLVNDKALELEERPVSMSCSLPTPYSCPRPNPCEFFQGNRPLRVMRLLHDVLRNRVVDVLLETGLLALDLAQLTARRLRALALQVAPPMGIDATIALNRLTTVCLAIRVRGKVDNAKINAKYVLYVNRVGVSYFTGSGKKETASKQDQVAFAHAGLQQLALPVAAHKRDIQATVYCPNRDS